MQLELDNLYGRKGMQIMKQNGWKICWLSLE